MALSTSMGRYESTVSNKPGATSINAQRGRAINEELSQTLGNKRGKIKYANPQRGAHVRGSNNARSTASTPKAPKTWSSNPARAQRQKERAAGKEMVCGPNGCMTKKRLERLRDR